MKKLIYTIATLLVFASFANAQIMDGINPKIKHDKNGFKFTVGGRFAVDAGYFSTDYTNMKSGFAITDARIRTSFSYEDWYFYADFDFSKGKVNQKNIFLRYNILKGDEGTHSLKLGYFNEPSGMNRNTSRYNMRFIGRPSSSISLSPGRALGFTYKYYSPMFFFDQGVFAENKYNNQKVGNQGFSVGGRWLYKPFEDSDLNAHIGLSARYAKISTGVNVNQILKTELELSSPMETYLDTDSKFLNAELPWASSNLNLGVEFLFSSERFFARGEYMINKIYKTRPDDKLFEAQLGGVWSWTTLSSWQNGNPIRTSEFDGGYLELGFLLFGEDYTYNNEYSVLNGSNNEGDLEVVARYNYTNLNDINKGEIFLEGKHRFYPGVVSDYPPVSTSVGGGNMHSGTLGLNYTISSHAKAMINYTYSSLDNVYYSKDKNIHTIQARLTFSF